MVFLPRSGEFLGTVDTAPVFVYAVAILHVEVFGYMMNQCRTLIRWNMSTHVAPVFPWVVHAFFVLIHDCARREWERAFLAFIAINGVSNSYLVFRGNVHRKCGFLPTFTDVVASINGACPVFIHGYTVFLYFFPWAIFPCYDLWGIFFGFRNFSHYDMLKEAGRYCDSLHDRARCCPF